MASAVYPQPALQHALRLTWGIQWDYIHRAAIYVEMGRIDEARAEAAKILELNPDFADKVRQEFGNWNFPKEAVDEMIDLLRQAGMDFPNEGPLTD